MRKIELSVVIAGLAPPRAVRGVLKAMNQQTARSQIEIVVVSQHDPGWEGADLVVTRDKILLHEARALGVQRASGLYVVLAEDHCFPDPDWAEATLERLREGWDGVGPALRSGSPDNLWALASFVLGYGQWVAPLQGSILPGHNAAVRRDLLAHRENLAEELMVGSLLMRELASSGARFCLEERARMEHWDCSNPGWGLLSFMAAGSGFGARRSQSWHPLCKIAYALAAPLIASLHWRRAFTQIRRTFMPSACLLPAAALALAWGLGESLGCALGAGVVGPYAQLGEVNRLAHTEYSFPCT